MIRPFRVLGLSVVGAVALAAAAMADAQQPIAKYSAQVVNFDAPVRSATGLVQIQITRWSTNAERDSLTNTLFEKGSKELLQVVSKLADGRVDSHAGQRRLSAAIRAPHDGHREPRDRRHHHRPRAVVLRGPQLHADYRLPVHGDPHAVEQSGTGTGRHPAGHPHLRGKGDEGHRVRKLRCHATEAAERPTGIALRAGASCGAR